MEQNFFDSEFLRGLFMVTAFAVSFLLLIKIETFENLFITMIKVLVLNFNKFKISISRLLHKKRNYERSKEIKKCPGQFLLRLAEYLPNRQAKKLKQEISDMRLEYYEALNEEKIWRAKFIVAFYYIGLSWSVVMWISDKAKEVIGVLPKKN
jgi:hypothetical protein